MSKFLKDKYKSLAPYTPGEQPKDRKFVKLNTNESPFPPSKKAIELARAEAERLIPGVTTCAVKKSLGSGEAICYPPSMTGYMLCRAAEKAACTPVAPFVVDPPYEIRIQYSDCSYLYTMKRLHPEIFEGERTVVMRGDNLLKVWSQYLTYEKEMTNA